MRSRNGSVRTAAGRAATACLLLLLLLSGCAQRAGGATGAPGSPSAAPPTRSDALVLRIQRVGGFLPVGLTEGALPVVSIYGDGRVITEGPMPAIYPDPALPNVQVQKIGADDVRALVEKALAAGVRDTADLGRPAMADAATTRFTVVSGGTTYVREVYALADAGGTTGTGGGTGGPATSSAPSQLTAEQEAARAKLLDLVGSLTDLEGTQGADNVGESHPYPPTSVAAVVTAYHPSPPDPPQQPQAWPAPALPGQPLGGQTGVSCLTATGDAARAVLTAAGKANALTPWTAADGSSWWVHFRPLLPDESGCADLQG